MLSKNDIQDLLEIVESANKKIDETDCPDYYLLGINWNEEESYWVVSYYSDYSNTETTNISVVKKGNNYMATGFIFLS